MADWKARRLGRLFRGHEENQNASKLTLEQKKAIWKVLQNPPWECGLPKELWDAPPLKKHLKATFDVVYESS